MLPLSSSGIPPKNIGKGYSNYVKSVKKKTLFARLIFSVWLPQSFLKWMSWVSFTTETSFIQLFVTSYWWLVTSSMWDFFSWSMKKNISQLWFYLKQTEARSAKGKRCGGWSLTFWQHMVWYGGTFIKQTMLTWPKPDFEIWSLVGRPI